MRAVICVLFVVPTSARNDNGRGVYDLQQSDFTILEAGRPQQLAQFSIDPSPLSVLFVRYNFDDGTITELRNALLETRTRKANAAGF